MTQEELTRKIGEIRNTTDEHGYDGYHITLAEVLDAFAAFLLKDKGKEGTGETTTPQAEQGGFLEMLKSHLAEIKELLENAKLVKSAFVNNTDVPIRFRTESGRWIELKEREERVFYFNKAVVGTGSELLTFNGEDYPGQAFSIRGKDGVLYLGDFIESSSVFNVENTQYTQITEVKNARNVRYTVELGEGLESYVYVGDAGNIAHSPQEIVETVHDGKQNVNLDVYDIHSDHLRVEVDGEEIQVYQQDASVAMYLIPARDARIRVTEVVQ